MDTDNRKSKKLKRKLNQPLLFLYAVGAILGAGIYAILGEITKVSNHHLPFSFLAAGALASLTAYSHSRLVRRFPKSGGEAEFVLQGLSSPFLSQVTAWMVALTGVISSATLAKSFVGYFQSLIILPPWLVVFALISLVTLIACIGIGESAWFVAIITIVELTGLGLIIFWGFQDLSSKLPELLAYSRPQNLEDYQLVWAGSFIAFYAFIGFEDIVNLAEETKNPEKNLPLAIFSALFACSFLYVLISFIALSSLSLDQLKNSQAPLADLYKQQGGNPQILTIIGLFAIINGLIAQVIMASRILYGTRHDLTVFKNFSKVDSRTSTPVFSTLFISCVILFFVFLLPLSQLASLTSFVILLVFSLVNFSLFVLSLRSESFKLFDLFFSGLALVANSLFLILKLSEHIF